MHLVRYSNRINFRGINFRLSNHSFGCSTNIVPPIIRVLFCPIVLDPETVFDTFEVHSENAASIGQVHRASKKEKKLAVKIQYPGVANSISSDLALVKPIALKMFNLKGKDTHKYFKEVEDKLLEETDYLQELRNSQFISKKAAKISNLKFPNYYSKWTTTEFRVFDSSEVTDCT